MKIIIEFRHPWSICDRVARIERTDKAGRMAQAVIRIAKELRHSDKYSSVFASYEKWTRKYSANPAKSLDEWEKATDERSELDRIIKFYTPDTYTVKELEDLTPEELHAISDTEAELLPAWLQERRKR